ncbi:hypothetical protein [uncultured Rothia sp.]
MTVIKNTYTTQGKKVTPRLITYEFSQHLDLTVDARQFSNDAFQLLPG